MKKITTILTLGFLFLFATTLSLSAQKCKYDYNKADPITGEATKGNSFSVWSFMGMSGWSLGFNKIGDTYYTGMFLRCSGNVREFIKKGDPITLKLSNGEVITINAQDEFLPVAQATQNGVVTTYNGKYNIDETILQKIAASAPTFIRMTIESKVYEREISAKDGKKASEAARCILQ